MCLKWDLIWNGLSAVGTIFAATVALWQSNRAERRALRVELNENTRHYIDSDNIVCEHCIGINICNIGNRTVEIEALYLYDKQQKKHGLDAIKPQNKGAFRLELPKALQPDGTLSLMLPHKWCSWFFQSELNVKADRRISESDRIHFFVRDTFGKSYHAKGESTYEEFLDRYNHE